MKSIHMMKIKALEAEYITAGLNLNEDRTQVGLINLIPAYNMDNKDVEIKVENGKWVIIMHFGDKIIAHTLDYQKIEEVGSPEKEGTEHLEQHGNIILDTRYWGCECEHEYIHLVSDNTCPVCGMNEIDCPNSRANEVQQKIAEGKD